MPPLQVIVEAPKSSCIVFGKLRNCYSGCNARLDLHYEAKDALRRLQGCGNLLFYIADYASHLLYRAALELQPGHGPSHAIGAAALTADYSHAELLTFGRPVQHGHVSQQMLTSTVITPRHYFPRLLHLAVRKPSLILCLSHAKGLMLAALLLTLMLWPGQDVAVLQAVLLRCCIHCVILRVRILKLQLPVGNVPAGEKQQVPSRHSSFTLPVCEHHHGLHKH